MEKTQDCLICFCLDKSGSMISVTDATCEGFNQFKTDQKANPGETVMTLTLFDTIFDTRFVGTPLGEVPDLGLTTNSYRPSGMTALFDAVGESIKKTEVWVKENNWIGRVMVVILTDGAENSSARWHVRNPRIDGDAFDIAGLIDWKQKEGWDFIFLGAGGTDWLERTFQNLPKENFYAYAGDAASHSHTHSLLNSAMTNSRSTGQSLASAMVEEVNNSNT